MSTINPLRLQFRYNELSLVFRIYIHLRQLRQGGCAHISGRLSKLPEGGLAVECPVCPHPGRNMELSKETLLTRPPYVPDLFTFLFNMIKPFQFRMFEMMHLSMDGNFKLKQKDRNFTDPPLANGYAYMVLDEKLMEHLAGCNGRKELKDGVGPCLTIRLFLF